jgi:hypothetical protein
MFLNQKLFQTKYGETFLKTSAWYRIQTCKAPAVLGTKRQYTSAYLGTQLCSSVRNSSKYTVKPAHSTVKRYEKAAQPLKLTSSTPNFLQPLGLADESQAVQLLIRTL